MRAAVLLFSLLFALAFPAKASHIVGGEIHYEHLGGNQYRIVIKLYRDCLNSFTPYPQNLHLAIYVNDTTLFQQIDIPVPPSDTIPNNINSPCLSQPLDVCVEEAVYDTIVTLPPIPGGYLIVYQLCCRNTIITNAETSGDDVGTSYTAYIPDTALAGYNSDPYFNLFPPTIICNAFPFVFDHSATDLDGDSLVYELCELFAGGSGSNTQPDPPLPPPFPPLPYIPPYTYLNPMGGSPPLAIDPVTGLLTVTPDAIGTFVVGVCVSEYRDGVLLSTHKRDFQFNITECTEVADANTAPQVISCDDFTANFPSNSTPNAVYHWDFGVPNVDDDTSNLFSPTYTYPDTGTYTAMLIVFPGTFCADTAIVPVVTYPGFQVGMITEDGCEGNPIQLNDSSSTVYGFIDSWTWEFGDGDSSSVQNPQHVYADAGNFEVQLIVTTNLGCIDTVQSNVDIAASPITSAYGDSIICDLDEAQIGIDAIGTFQWTPNYNINDITLANPLVAPDVTTTYYVTATSPNGCVSTDSVVVVVYGDITASVSSDTTVCPNEPVLLQGTGGINFSWFPSTGLSSTSDSSTTATVSQTTTYLFTTSVGSCVDSAVVTVTVLPYPEPNIEGNYVICEGDSVQLSAGSLSSVVWSPQENLSNADTLTPWVSPPQTTWYYVTGEDTNSCPVVVFDSVLVTVTQNDYTVAAETTIVLGTTANIYASGGSSYQWLPTNGLVDPTAPSTVAAPTVTTTYTVTVGFPGGCYATDTVVVNVLPDPLIFFPNAFSPNGDDRNDRFKPIYLGLVDAEKFSIYNRWGALVYTSDDIDEGWDGTYKGEPQDLGVFVYYFIGRGTVTGKSFVYKGDLTLMR